MNKEILRLAIPNIISNVSVPLLSTVDTAIMGQLSGLHIGAVGLGSMIFNFIYWNFGFLRMGTTGLTAQALGKKDQAAQIKVFAQAIFFSILIAFLLLVFQHPIGKLSFFLMNISPEQLDLISEYFYIRIWAAPASLILYAFMGWFFGMQNAIFPLILALVINLSNVGLNFLFVFGYGMEVDGVALATTISQYLGLLLAFILFFLRYRSTLSHLRVQTVLLINELNHFLRINRDIFIRTFLLTLSFAIFHSLSSLHGELILAANIILLQFLSWMSYAIDGFAFASESLVGKYAGANNNRKTIQAINYSFIWGMGIAVLFSLSYLFFGDSLISIFTKEEKVQAITASYLFWMILFPIISTPCYLWDGIYIGLTASKAMRNSMLISFSVFLLSYYLVLDNFGNQGLWLSFLLFMATRGGMQYILFLQKRLQLR